MPPKNSQGHKRSVSALSNVSNVSSPSTISIELYDSGEEGAEMQSTNEACSLTGTLMSTSCSLSTEAGENSLVSRKKKRTSWTWLHFDEIGNTKTCK
ncbi:Uncharacterized protein APZ42_007617 [Daphnia magna]|uniref:Uncharacterized protein n=1 Tax=Daphnia magna TaxID=35525 RepID=A0A162D1Q5_9CRUS|nr:Uncharacterized protein APZ42_007617 [Daphnia magna]